jgi:hypothetical protein
MLKAQAPPSAASVDATLASIVVVGAVAPHRPGLGIGFTLLERVQPLWLKELVDLVPTSRAASAVDPFVSALVPGELLLQPVIEVEQLNDLE